MYQRQLSTLSIRSTVSRPKKVPAGQFQMKPLPVQPTDTLVQLIAGEGLPLSIVESANFCRFVSALDPQYKLPSQELISTGLLTEMSASIQSFIKLELQRAQTVCLSLSLVHASQETRTLIGMTAHTIIDWRLHSMLLSLSRQDGLCTKDAVRHQYEQVVEVYELAHKATCVAVHDLTSVEAPHELSLPGFYADSTNQSESCIILRLESVDTDVKEPGSVALDFLPRSSPCFVSCLQLVVRDCLRGLSEDMKSSVNNVSNVISYVQSSEAAGSTLKKGIASNSKDSRWISQLDMIRNLLCLSEEEFAKFEITQFLKEDRDLLQEFCAILYPIEHAMRLIQNSSHVSAGFIIPVTRGIKHKLDQLSPVHSQEMLSSLKTSVEVRLSRYEQDDTYITASVLDPRFKLRWSNHEEQYIIKSLFLNKVSLLQSCYPSYARHLSPPLTKPLRTEDDLFSFMTPNDSSHTLPFSTLEAETEVIKYLSQPCLDMDTDPLQFWKAQVSNFPLLANMASTYLAVPVTPPQTPLSCPNISSVSNETFQKLMIVKYNSHLQIRSLP